MDSKEVDAMVERCVDIDAEYPESIMVYSPDFTRCQGFFVYKATPKDEHAERLEGMRSIIADIVMTAIAQDRRDRTAP